MKDVTDWAISIVNKMREDFCDEIGVKASYKQMPEKVKESTTFEEYKCMTEAIIQGMINRHMRS